MDALRRANFTISMLDKYIIAPRKTLPGSSDEPAFDSAPVFLLQANFITGGLLLTFVAQHNTMNMTGQAQVINLFSKACRNEQFTSEELSSGNLDRRNLIPLLDDSDKPGSELARQIVKPHPSPPISKGTDGHPAPPPPPKCTWAYFSFHPSSLTALKSLATKTITLPSG
jgi:trichothecene 3-O-acetyltransferase